jgi:cytoskeletal protein CcmA (bactofilin family)
MDNPSDIRSTLLEDVEINGSIKFKGTLNFDGSFKNGEIKGEDLTIGPKAHIEGNIESGALTLHGSVSGDVFVTGKCNLTGAAKLIGSLTTNRLVMDEGATFIGQAEITPEGKKNVPQHAK